MAKIRKLQDTFFETRSLPMADLFEAAETDAHHYPPETMAYYPGAATTKACDLYEAAAANKAKAEAEKPKEANHCLQCGKVSIGMFCNAKCKSKWVSSMNAWSKTLPKLDASAYQPLNFDQ